ncbi:metallophosphoesterase [Hyalangium gracile]|uniref:metallophosphoesterase n=1 Tax=Hyalangium gracile TaxID=394092 RepID=UPI001CCF23B2|nr:metallophosphoesterase [Hyalangium gracile]
MTGRSQDVFFAAVGDVHGRMHQMVRLLQEWSRKSHRQLAFVLQVGDFEPHRHEADLATMAAPARYKHLGDFSEFHSRRARFPWPVYFIGGNHEPYGYLDSAPDGFELTLNCRYLGRVGTVETHGLRVAGLSGILQEETFRRPRPSVDRLGTVSPKAFAGFTEQDVERALALERADVLLLHEWPSGLVDPADEKDFEQQRRSMRYDAVGNEYARLVVEALQPRLVLCGHMHKAYRGALQLPSGRMSTVRCLDHVAHGASCFAVFRLTDGELREVTEPG